MRPRIRTVLAAIGWGAALCVGSAWLAAAVSPITTGAFLPAGRAVQLELWPKRWTTCRTDLLRRGPAIRYRLLSESEWMGSALGWSPLTAPNRTVSEVATGWPWPALRWREEWPRPNVAPAWWYGGAPLPSGLPIRSAPPRRIPLEPLPLAFAGDSAVFAMIVGVGVAGLGAGRRRLRRRGNRCPGCGYDLSGSGGRACPECGAGAASA